MEGYKVCVLKGVLLLWRRGCFLSGGVQSLCSGGGTFAVEEGVFFKWRDAKFVFWRGYFCYGGGGVFEVEGCKVCVLEGVLLLWRRECF